ncbi:sigma-E factor regulatory protein RseB domain-containing protein [Streptomyces sp. PA03-1a]|nr:sigma-E factor regulatory protein RseB domain-containing protein [Streptomyces sp. PA03-1a]
MAPIQPMDDDREPRRRTKAIRYAVPVAAAGVAAATIGLVPALANAGSPDLPGITAEELIAKVAASDTQTISGSVRISTDFGLPALLTGATGAGGPFGGGGGGRGDSSADPKEQLTQLLAGSHTLRVAADGPQKQKVSIVRNAAEYSLIHNGDEVWAYDSGSNQAYHLTGLPREAQGEDRAKGDRELPEGWPATPQEAAKKILDAADDSSTVTVDGTARIAGRDAYQLVVRPKATDSTVGSIRIGVDAGTGVPLKFTLAPRGGGKAIVDVAFTKVDFSRPAASVFDFTPPKGAKVTTEKAGEKADGKADGKAGQDARGAHEEFGDLGGLDGLDGLDGLEGLGVLGKGWDSIAELKLPQEALNAGPSEGGAKAPGLGGQGLLGTFGKEVKGEFGTGTVVGTRLVNALITDSGKVYVGTVTQGALIKAADAAAE